MREPLWWSHPGDDLASGVECVSCGNLDGRYRDTENENPLCATCWKELR